VDRGDLWWVNFPFGDIPEFKRRPTLVVGVSPMGRNQEQVVLVAMVTSKLEQKRQGDVDIADFRGCGLSEPSLIKARRLTHVNPSAFQDPIKDRIGQVSDDCLRHVLMEIGNLF
jgi:mRNA-degrading endonuclease toxin of MazEF toxin-antitoxin module